MDSQFRQIVKQVVDDRDKNKTRRDDLIQVILDLRDKHGRTEYNDTVIAGHSMTFLVNL
jgi:cytochrome P450